MSKLLEHKIALITGAGSGIGLQLARSFAQEGAAVIVSDVQVEKALAAVEGLRNKRVRSARIGV